KLLNATAPLPTLVPMSKVVAFCNGPVPLVRFKFTFRLAASPMVESLPNWSRVFTTGCVSNGEPAVAPPGCVANASAVTAAGLIANLNHRLLRKHHARRCRRRRLSLNRQLVGRAGDFAQCAETGVGREADHGRGAAPCQITSGQWRARRRANAQVLPGHFG